MLDKIAPYWKAVVGFVVPGAGSLIQAMTDVSPGGSTITKNELIAAVLICIITSGAVYGVPNKDPDGIHGDESVQDIQ
jgi:hypothetical protein